MKNHLCNAQTKLNSLPAAGSLFPTSQANAGTPYGFIYPHHLHNFAPAPPQQANLMHFSPLYNVLLYPGHPTSYPPSILPGSFPPYSPSGTTFMTQPLSSPFSLIPISHLNSLISLLSWPTPCTNVSKTCTYKNNKC